MLEYLRAALQNYVVSTLFQKLGMRGMPALQQIGGEAAGMTVIITGPTSGIGWATAAELARRGAHVVLACRSQSKGDAMIKQLAAEAAACGQPDPSLEVRLLDLSRLESVRQFVVAWEAQQRPLHALISNAGMFNMGVGRGETPDGFELHMQTNHLSHFLLTLGLLPALQRGAQQPPGAAAGFRPRIVAVTSAMHHFGYRLGPADPQMQQRYSASLAYGNSKLAQVLFSRELARRLAAAGVDVDVLAVHPGNVLTDVVRSLPAAVQRAYRALMARVLLTPEQGARASVYAATDPGAPAAAGPGGYLDANARPGRLLAVDDALPGWVWSWSSDMVQLPADWDVAPVAM